MNQSVVHLLLAVSPVNIALSAVMFVVFMIGIDTDSDGSHRFAIEASLLIIGAINAAPVIWMLTANTVLDYLQLCATQVTAVDASAIVNCFVVVGVMCAVLAPAMLLLMLVLVERRQCSARHRSRLAQPVALKPKTI